MRISLIIPARNEEKLLGKCLSSVYSSVLVFHEIIVVDNGSTDNTAAIAGQWPALVRVVYEPQQGLSHARERGWREATGDVIAYIDADTEIPPDWSWDIKDEFIDPDVVCVSNPVTYPELPWLQRWFVKYVWWLGISRLSYAFTGRMVNGACFAIRRETLERMGGIQVTDFFGEDTMIAKAAAKHGKVKFLFDLWVPASARRLKQGGLWLTAAVYALNYLRPGITRRHADYR